MLLVSKNRPSGAPAFSAAVAFTCLAALGLLACSASDVPAGAGGTGSGTAGSGNSNGGSTPVTGAGAPAVATAGQATTFGGGGSGGALLGGTSGAPQGGSAPQGGASPGGAGAAQGGAAHTRDHCLEGYDPDPTDATMKADGPVEYTKSNQVDLTVQPAVLDWFKARVWEQAHFQWHNIRRCKSGGATADPAGGGVNPCKTNPELIPTNQENQGPGDGLEFLAMHRHMIQSLKQLWPKHTEQFEGWEHFPTKASDVPQQWQAAWSAWMSNIATAGAQADDPASNMNVKGFETEGDFGQWIQTTSGLHGALHFKWVRSGNSDHGLGNQFANIDNYMFWKMHGWIDKVWDRYRAAKGKKPDDADIKAAVLAQCRQMDQLAIIVKPSLGNPDCTPAPVQTGVYVEKIRPIFESATNKCTGCHGRVGPSGNLTLGGSECVKSSDIVAALLKPSERGGQFKLIEPGQPDKSWLYLKVTGKSATAGCTAQTGGADCETQSMPFGGGITLTQAEQDALKQWITDGAKAPQ